MFGINDVNVGLLIEQRLNQLGISKSEFGRRIGVAQQNVNRILEKASIDTDKLVKISKVLEYNFFKDFIPEGDLQNNASQSSSCGDNYRFSGNGNQINGRQSHHNINGDGAAEISILEEKIKGLEKVIEGKDRLLEEKERTIKILMDK
ncbi:MAG: helix-turn-helix domain-containing protein [Prevotellaceae bacterium]|nr:helix-turn-helix domain-containing protein [Prevotellaceae bacterium]